MLLVCQVSLYSRSEQHGPWSCCPQEKWVGVFHDKATILFYLKPSTCLLLLTRPSHPIFSPHLLSTVSTEEGISYAASQAEDITDTQEPPKCHNPTPHRSLCMSPGSQGSAAPILCCSAACLSEQCCFVLLLFQSQTGKQLFLLLYSFPTPTQELRHSPLSKGMTLIYSKSPFSSST